MIFSKIFGGVKMQEVATQRSEIELRKDLAEAEKQIATGEGDILCALESRDRISRELQAHSIRAEKAADGQYRAEINAKREAYIRQVAKEVAELWLVMPRVRWALSGLAFLENEYVGGFDGKSFSALTGLKQGTAGRLATACAQELRGTTFADYVGREPETNPPQVRDPGDPGIIGYYRMRDDGPTRISAGPVSVEFWGNTPP